MRYIPLELDVSSIDERGGYRVAARSPAGDGEAMVRFPVDELTLEDHLKAIRLALLLSSAAPLRRLAPKDEKAVQQFGDVLFETFFVDDVRSLFEASRQRATQEEGVLRIVLRIRPPELAVLPWEFLYDSRRDDYLSLSGPLVRYPEVLEAVRPLKTTPPLRILGMVAGPRDREPLDAAREQQRLHLALEGLQRAGRVQLTWVEGGTWRELQRAIHQQQWHVFHFVGHGGFDPETCEGRVALVGDDGGTYFLTASKLATLLRPHFSLRLALLNSCESGMGSQRDAFSSTASVLMRNGMPAVLAMQYEISDTAAIEFSRAFYEAMAAGRPVDEAVTEARVTVSLSRVNTIEWGTPVLYLRAPDGQIFDLPPETSLPPKHECPARYELGVRALAGGRWGEAEQAFLAVIAHCSDYSDAHAKLSQARKQRELEALNRRVHEASRPTTARERSEKVVPLKPNHRVAAAKLQEAGVADGSRTRTKRILLAAAFVIVAAFGAVTLRVWLPWGGSGPFLVMVPGDRTWSDSQKDLRAGDSIEISATGQVQYQQGATSGPDGVPNRGDLIDAIPGVRHSALIARLGESGSTLLVGSHRVFSVDAPARLFLGINDQDPQDNTGSYQVSIYIR